MKFTNNLLKNLLFILLALHTGLAQAISLADLNFWGDLSLGLRQFQKDNNSLNKDQHRMLEGHLFLDYEGNNFKVYMSSFGRHDENDTSRNLVNLDEAYYKYFVDSWSFSIGHHIFNWSVLEVFHPVDSINSRNLDANADKIERLGQPAFVITKEFDSSIFQLITLINTVPPLVPSPYNRNGPQLQLQAPRFVEDDYTYASDPDMFEWVLHYLHNFESFDLDVHIARKFDTANPVVATPKTGNISPSIEDLKIVPYFLPVYQLGVAIQGSFDEFLYKIEHMHYDFDNYEVEFFIPPTVLTNTSKLDFSLSAFGIEYSKAYANDQQGLYFAEYQTILGTTIEQARVLNAFQRDIAFGYRHSFNDFKGHELIAVIIHDLDHYNEQVYNISHSFRITDKWKMKTDVRIIQAPKPSKEQSLENFSGLKLISESDNILLTLMRFF